MDISGSFQGAGGVGGLLIIIKGGIFYMPTYDANGNIMAYANTSGSFVAKYDYSSFGGISSQSGDLAGAFIFRFSTKPYCDFLNKIEYELRKYDPQTGRWLNRDPIEESGGHNLYLYCVNNPSNKIDLNGNLPVLFPAIAGCTLGTGMSLISSLMNGDSVCQCICKAIGSCLLDGAAAQLAAAGYAGCVLGGGLGALNAAKDALCDSGWICKKTSSTPGICYLINALFDFALGCAFGELPDPVNPNLELTEKIKTFRGVYYAGLSKLVGMDLSLYCGIQ